MNQYTNVQTLGYKHIAGVALATNAVTVNSAPADRRGEWFDREITINNVSAPVWQNVSITDGTVTSNGGFVFPKNDQTLTYDLDGNLSSDGIWTYEWDGENRLKAMSMTAVSAIPDAQRKRLEFSYDFMNRRFSKVLKSWNGSGFASPSTNLFVYDGWSVLVTLTAQLSVVDSSVWGQDLSGTIEGAGGVGGLLIFSDNTIGRRSAHFVSFDGNGNVMGLVNCVEKTLSARYEYSGFGETLRATGPACAANPFRFSTKYRDDQGDLIYYGYRYYSPAVGRWLGKDPLEEKGGVNLFGFVLNIPTTRIDTLGDVAIWVTEDLRIDADDTRGTHVHDYGNNVAYAYGVDANGDPALTALKGHESEFNLTRARASMRGILQNREAFQALKSANGSLWRRAGTAAGRISRATVRATGKAIKAAGRAAGVACALFAIMEAAEGAEQVNNALDDYARDARNGDQAYMDLDAITVAVGVQEMTGSYFITMDVLGIMLQ